MNSSNCSEDSDFERPAHSTPERHDRVFDQNLSALSPRPWPRSLLESSILSDEIDATELLDSKDIRRSQ